MKKIKILRANGPILFLGSSNAMTMMYAWELKRLGYDVIYFVDSPIDKKLNRPENHYPEIQYPYPEWIIEWPIKSQILLPLLPSRYSGIIEKKISEISEKPIQACVLNGFFISLAPYIFKSKPKISIPHGSDLDSWCDLRGIKNLSKTFNNRSFFKFLPKKISSYLINYIVQTQFRGASNCNIIAHFPKGFNKFGDRVIEDLTNLGVHLVERYDISFEPISKESRVFKKNSAKLNIFSGVRFTYKTFTEGNEGYNKGNDIIIKGLAKYYEKNKDIVINFVEKGPDVAHAKKLCDELGLSSAVVWHKEMTFKELLKLYNDADICFDQVGNNWMAAIGGYALWLGKPLICNISLVKKTGLWPENNPICHASNDIEIFEQLNHLEVESNRLSVSEKSKIFAENYLTPLKTLFDIFEIN